MAAASNSSPSDRATSTGPTRPSANTVTNSSTDAERPVESAAGGYTAGTCERTMGGRSASCEPPEDDALAPGSAGAAAAVESDATAAANPTTHHAARVTMERPRRLSDRGLGRTRWGEG